MMIQALPRMAMTSLGDIQVPYLIISIKNTGSSDVTIADNPYCKGILRLAFDDLTRDLPTAIKPNQAKQITDFIYKYSPFVDMIICQCEAGHSRSAGVAAALCCILGEDDSELYRSKAPNHYVKSMIMRAAGLTPDVDRPIVVQGPPDEE